MMGLAYLAALFLYLVVLAWAMRAAWRVGKSKSTACAWVYASVAFLALYLPFFWEDIPTLVMRASYCAKDGGLRVYVPPEKWIQEHRDRLSELFIGSGGKMMRKPLPNGWKRELLLNTHVASEFRRERIELPFYIERRSTRLIDINENTVLAANVQYFTGAPSRTTGIKFWLFRSDCDRDESIKFDQLRRAFFLSEY